MIFKILLQHDFILIENDFEKDLKSFLVETI